MALRNKIDSNETNLAIAEEVIGQPGVLPVTPVWVNMEPNEYDDFGGEPELLSRRPINSSRQRKKGSIVDLEATGGFNQDFTNENSQMLTRGFMYANYRDKPTAAVTAVSATGFVVGDETPFRVGAFINATGFNTPANNGLKIVTSVDSGTHEVRVAGLAVEGAPPASAKITVVGFEAAAGDLVVDTTGPLPALTSTALDFTTLGVIPGEFIFIGGDSAPVQFASPENNGIKRIRSVSANRLVLDKSDKPMVAEPGTGLAVQIYLGRVIKNELANRIIRRTFQLERQMGAPDTDFPNQIQAEYVLGAYPNEMEMVIESADKINVNYSFVAITNDQRDSTVGIKAGSRPIMPESDAYNTSTDFSRIKLALVSNTNEAPEHLFAFVTELTLNINNNVSLNKAVGYLGGFDATIGLFEVSAEITAYFTKIEAVQAIRQNRDVTLDYFVCKENKGFAVDLPLVALGGGLSEVELDEPIMIPLESDAATAVKMDPNFDHTLLMVYFDYLPDLAQA